MTNRDIIPIGRQLQRAGFRSVPALFLDAGEKTWQRFVEFFTTNIRNRNTREAYARAVSRFSLGCGDHNLRLEQLSPFIVAQYVEELCGVMSAPSVKQQLAAVRMLFDAHGVLCRREDQPATHRARSY